METFYFGNAPAFEDCVQVGTEGYDLAARREGARWIARILEVCGPLPEGMTLRCVRHNHDFGGYYEVIGKGDVEAHPAIWDYANRVDSDPRLQYWGDREEIVCLPEAG
jgi:hypothetical protein